MSEAFDVRIGHVLDVLADIPDESIDCCVCSPPYWGLRNYSIPDQIWGGDPAHEHVWGEEIVKNGCARRQIPHGDGRPSETDSYALARIDVPTTLVTNSSFFCECGAWRGSLGLEPRLQLFVEHIVMVFREVRRVLKPQGTCWLNLGDSYATGAGKVGEHPGGGSQGERWNGNRGAHTSDNSGKHGPSLEAMGPRVQPNRMPIAGLKPKDLVGVPWRCAFALQDDGWWLRSEIIWHKPNPMPESVTDRPTKSHEQLFLLAKSEKYFYDAEAIKEPASLGTHERYARGRSDTHKWADGGPGNQTIATNRPGSKFGRKLAEPGSGIKNNSSFDQAMAVMPDFRNKRSVWTIPAQPTPDAHFATYPIALAETCILAGCPVGGTVLDPFSGAGTTGLAAIKHGRNYLGIELNPEYVKITQARTERHAPLFA